MASRVLSLSSDLKPFGQLFHKSEACSENSSRRSWKPFFPGLCTCWQWTLSLPHVLKLFNQVWNFYQSMNFFLQGRTIYRVTNNSIRGTKKIISFIKTRYLASSSNVEERRIVGFVKTRYPASSSSVEEWRIVGFVKTRYLASSSPLWHPNSYK